MPMSPFQKAKIIEYQGGAVIEQFAQCVARNRVGILDDLMLDLEKSGVRILIGLALESPVNAAPGTIDNECLGKRRADRSPSAGGSGAGRAFNTSDYPNSAIHEPLGKGDGKGMAAISDLSNQVLSKLVRGKRPNRFIVNKANKCNALNWVICVKRPAH